MLDSNVLWKLCQGTITYFIASVHISVAMCLHILVSSNETSPNVYII